MYIHPFALGVAVTLIVEVVAVIAFGVISSYKKPNNKK